MLESPVLSRRGLGEFSTRDRVALPPSGPVSTFRDEAHEFAIKLFSTAFLGHGYIPRTIDKSGQLFETVLESYVDRLEDIVTITNDDSAHFVIRSPTYEKSIDGLKRAFQSSARMAQTVINSVFPDDSSRSSCAPQLTVDTDSGKEKIVYAAACIRAIKCNLSSISSLERVKNAGTHIVMGGWIYFAYKIFFFITNRAVKVEDLDPLHPSRKTSSSGLSEELKSGKRIFIETKVETHGDFRFFRRFSIPKNINELTAMIDAVHQEYLSRANTITMRHFCIDEQSLSLNALYLPMLSHYRAYLPFTDHSLGKTHLESTLSKRVDFLNLSRKIQEKTPGNYNRFNGRPFSVEVFLSSLEKVFSTVINKRKLLKNPSISYTAVLGAPKRGTSLFIGYLLGARLSMKQGGQAIHNRNRGWYFDYYSGGDAYPQLGHRSSLNKGFDLFQKYLETSGLFDFTETEMSVCSCLATKLGFEMFRPDRIIIMMSPLDFINTAGRGAINIIEKVKKSIRNLSDPNILQSILIVVKEHLIHPTAALQYTKDDIILSLQDLITIQTQERDQHLGTDAEFRKRVSTQIPLSEEEIQSFITKLEIENPELGKIVANHQENITVLKTILLLGNIVVADLRTNRTREEIDRWEHLEKIASKQRRRDGHIRLGESTQMQHLVHHGSEKTHEILTALVDYFNHLFEERTTLKTQQFGAKLGDYPGGCPRLIEIENELTTYHEYCMLISQVLNKLQFCDPDCCTHWKCYSDFCRDVASFGVKPLWALCHKWLFN